MLKPLTPDDIRSPFARYSHGVEVPAGCRLVFCSGQLGIDHATAQLVEGIEGQAERALVNLEAVLAAAGMTTADVVKTTIFLSDLGNFATVNAIYAKHFPAPAPARSTVQVAALPLKALIELEVVARKSE